MDYLTLRIPADTKEKISSTTWTGEPPFQGSNGMYEQCGCKMIQVVPAAYEDIRRKHYLDGELFCDEEGLMNGAQHNWRASQLRYWYMKDIEDQLTPDWRDWTTIVGDAVFCVEATDKNLKIMEDILDS
jgi:hypothetical protein